LRTSGEQRKLVQAGWAFCVVRATLAKFGLHGGNMKFNSQIKNELVYVYLYVYRACVCVCTSCVKKYTTTTAITTTTTTTTTNNNNR
jgi:hypothetical protein